VKCRRASAVNRAARQLRKGHDKRRDRTAPLSACQLRRAKALAQGARLLCRDAIQNAILTVEGVTGDTAKPGKTTFMVTGDFEGASLIKALNAAGFSALVAQ
jgi:hypothetical protein